MPEPAILTALRDLAPGGAGCGWADPRLDHGLYPGEGLTGAIPSRLREFSAGRAAARAAMAEIGISPSAIPHGSNREPIWPVGVIGSITHTAAHCLAIVLPTDQFRGVGIDLEEHADLERDLWPAVLHPVERQRLEQIPQCHQPKSALTYFCAKEAVYKAQYPITRQLLDFQDIVVSVQSGKFEAQFQCDVDAFAKHSTIIGRTKVVDRHLLALATC
ncbi:4'-phosphopantetheinyl transferase family protein [Thioclava sp. FR2]|uniref:4'-phosphopantetheinyl transferase family protein n=1 Tax=Thioclava sp. FR2 TaxID=3445780 RepID=UPI003EB70A83